MHLEKDRDLILYWGQMLLFIVYCLLLDPLWFLCVFFYFYFVFVFCITILLHFTLLKHDTISFHFLFSVTLFISLFISTLLSVCLSVRPSVRLFVRLSACLSGVCNNFGAGNSKSVCLSGVWNNFGAGNSNSSQLSIASVP